MRIQPHDHTGVKATAYVLNSSFSVEGQESILALHAHISKYFGEYVWFLPLHSLHITLMDWIAPLVQYDVDPDVLFEKHGDRYISILEDILQKEGPIHVHFDRIKVSPTTIFIQGTDHGEYERIRESFLKRTNLLPGTKLPPQIIHASIARFKAEADFTDAEDFITSIPLDFEERIKEFRLVRETVLPMQEYEALKTFPLEGK